MDSSETREYLKRQVRHAHGGSQGQRERFYILELVYGLYGKINRLEKMIEKLAADFGGVNEKPPDHDEHATK